MPGNVVRLEVKGQAAVHGCVSTALPMEQDDHRLFIYRVNASLQKIAWSVGNMLGVSRLGPRSGLDDVVSRSEKKR